MEMNIKRLATGFLYVVVSLLGLGIALIVITNKRLPEGRQGPEAEAFTDAMLAAVNCDHWDRLRYLSWSYRNDRHYVWDKLYNLAEIRYDDLRILLNVNSIDGIVWKNGRRLSLEAKRPYIARAWKHWCNDAFWLNPVCKVRDHGTIRKLVKLNAHEHGLLVTHAQGGMSPGDSFLWITDENYLPVSWRMWARVLPLKGIKASWEDWAMAGEAKVSTRHRIGPYQITLQDVCTGSHHSELGLESDPFVDFVTE
jgi:hypothetical protein